MNYSRIAQKLIDLRGDKTQDNVAREIGISVSALSMYEMGKRIPRDEIKMKLAHYYNTSVEKIFFAE